VLYHEDIALLTNPEFLIIERIYEPLSLEYSLKIWFKAKFSKSWKKACFGGIEDFCLDFWR
jgi:hypothetical protein